MKRIAALDLIRGIAAFSVAVPHYLMLGSDMPAAEVTSVLAVEIFFALSGFVLAPQILFCIQRQHWGDVGIFLIRRWMRTIPPYLFALVLISTLVGELFSADFFRYALYVQNLFRQANLNDYYSIAWSLSVEEWLYVSLPAIMFLVLRLCSTSSDRACALVAVGFIVVITLLRLTLGPADNWGEGVRRVVIFRVDGIAYGFLLYVFVRNYFPLESGKPGWGPRTTATVLLGLTSLIAFQGTKAIGIEHGAINQGLYPLYAAAFGLSVIFFFYVMSPWLQQSSILSSVSAYLGRISYSVYLFHVVFAQALDKKLAMLPIGLQLAIYLCAVTAFCTGFYYYFERPILEARPRYRSVHEPLIEPLSEPQSDFRRGADQKDDDKRMMAMPNKTTVLAFFGTGLICFAGLEVALRHHVGAPLLSLQDVRKTSVINILQTGGARYDAQLGWAQLPDFASPEFNTYDYGIRKNSPSAGKLPLGAILAVGDSYTAGSEVMDNESWPAQLEQHLGQPVLNAGVGGYGVDQIVLNAERLLPIVKPRAVIVGIHEDTIQRTTYKTFSTPKPYFLEEGGAWVIKNQPVPAPEDSTPEPLYKRALARLVTAHLLFNRVAHDWWFSTGGQRFERTANDPGREVCFLLGRLQDRLRAEHIPGLVVVQYYGWSYWRSRPRDAATQEVLACARRAGYAVIDEHDQMAAIAQRSTSELKQYYVMTADGAQFGHPSKLGNQLIASLIAAEFRNIKTASGSK